MLQRRIQSLSFPGGRWAFGCPPNKLSQAHNHDALEAAWGISLHLQGSIKDARLPEGADNLEMVHLAREKVLSGKDMCGLSRGRA